MWSFLASLGAGLFNALFGAINNWLTARRTDKNAKDLGKTKAELSNAQRGAAEVAEAQEASRAMADSLRDDPGRVRLPDRDSAKPDSDGIS